jgi:hypothetical protein
MTETQQQAVDALTDNDAFTAPMHLRLFKNLTGNLIPTAPDGMP